MKKVLSLILAAVMCACLFAFASCTNAGTGEKKVLKVAMECAYAPYNWAQTDNSNGSVPIHGRADFANGYDVMIAKKICEKNGWDLEIYSLDWDALIPAVQTGQVDCVIAGQSMTEDRMKQIDFAGPYLYATIVCLVKSDSAYANATSIADFAGAKCTSQLGTIWYETCLPQVTGATILAGKESAPAMLMALETGEVDFVCTDMPTAQAAVIAYPDLKILDFTGKEGGFVVDEGDINIGISVQKGNTELFNAINKALEGMKADDFNKIM
ncbi:MAG: transporter substrate-binding domain-containing protein, partial [Clostridia bacterium]|nr:transporter substrate-binding domain-containing protein [Clostridia bacterium]